MSSTAFQFTPSRKRGQNDITHDDDENDDQEGEGGYLVFFHPRNAERPPRRVLDLHRSKAMQIITPPIFLAKN